jgi:hypothetical protein
VYVVFERAIQYFDEELQVALPALRQDAKRQGLQKAGTFGARY